MVAQSSVDASLIITGRVAVCGVVGELGLLPLVPLAVLAVLAAPEPPLEPPQPATSAAAMLKGSSRVVKCVIIIKLPYLAE
jgi:hypothetical protein